jgi:hypothetical protein
MEKYIFRKSGEEQGIRGTEAQPSSFRNPELRRAGEERQEVVLVVLVFVLVLVLVLPSTGSGQACSYSCSVRFPTPRPQ